MLSQDIQVLGGDAPGPPRQLDRIVQQGAGKSIQRRLAVIRFDRLNQRIVVHELTEILSVRLHSIVAVISGRDHNGHHLALRPGQFRGAEHRLLIQGDTGCDVFGLEALDFQYLENATRALGRPIVLLLEKTCCLAFLNSPDPCHHFKNCGFRILDLGLRESLNFQARQVYFGP